MYVPPYLAEICLKAKMIGLLFIFKYLAIFILALIPCTFFHDFILQSSAYWHFQNGFWGWFVCFRRGSVETGLLCVALVVIELTLSVHQTGSKLTEVCLPVPPKCWD